MASILRLGCGSRQLLTKILQNEKSGMLALVRPVTLQSMAEPPIKNLGHDERNMKLGRPQSPHLTIYKFQVTSMLSISHRITGLFLTGYTIMLAGAAVYLPESVPSYIDAISHAHIGSATLFAGKFALAFPLTYHFWNGIRHLIWDLGLALTLREIYATGFIMLAVSVASAIALSAM